MSPTNYRDDVIPQDTAEDDSSAEANTSQPLSQSEIDDLLYGGERSTTERLDLLRALRADIAERQAGDFGDDDPAALLGEIDDRINELRGAERDGVAPGALDIDPLAHRETLSPDSDELEDLVEEDEASLEEEDEWLDDEDEAAAGNDQKADDADEDKAKH